VSNEDVYAAGLLSKALDPATQPREIRAFMRAEIELLFEFIERGTRIIDIGCGTGRHLKMLSDRLRLGVGVDYDHRSIADAQRHAGAPGLHFITGDATAIPVRATFDFAICTTNTLGTMKDKEGVLGEMRRLAPQPGTRLVSVYSARSVSPRREWYRRLGHVVVHQSAESLETDGGFRSEHFSKVRIRQLIGDCIIRPLTEIGYAVTF